MVKPVKRKPRKKNIIDELCKRQVNDKNSNGKLLFFSVAWSFVLFVALVFRVAVRSACVRGRGLSQTQPNIQYSIDEYATNNGMHHVSLLYAWCLLQCILCSVFFFRCCCCSFVCSLNFSAEARTMFNELLKNCIIYNNNSSNFTGWFSVPIRILCALCVPHIGICESCDWWWVRRRGK